VLSLLPWSLLRGWRGHAEILLLLDFVIAQRRGISSELRLVLPILVWGAQEAIGSQSRGQQQQWSD